MVHIVTPTDVLNVLAKFNHGRGSRWLESAWLYTDLQYPMYSTEHRNDAWAWSCWNNALPMNFNWENV